VEIIRELSGMDYLTLMHGDATYSLPSGERMMEFVEKLADRPRRR